MIRRCFANLEEILSIALVGALCMVVTLQVFCNLFLHALSWTEELGKILLVWVTMVGSALALKKGEHFAIEMLHAWLPAGPRRAAKVLVALLIMVFAGILLYEGFLMAARNLRVITPAMEISRAIPYASIPAGGALMLIRGTEMLLRALRRSEVPG